MYLARRILPEPAQPGFQPLRLERLVCRSINKHGPCHHAAIVWVRQAASWHKRLIKNYLRIYGCSCVLFSGVGKVWKMGNKARRLGPFGESC